MGVACPAWRGFLTISVHKVQDFLMSFRSDVGVLHSSLSRFPVGLTPTLQAVRSKRLPSRYGLAAAEPKISMGARRLTLCLSAPFCRRALEVFVDRFLYLTEHGRQPIPEACAPTEGVPLGVGLSFFSDEGEEHSSRSGAQTCAHPCKGLHSGNRLEFPLMRETLFDGGSETCPPLSYGAGPRN